MIALEHWIQTPLVSALGWTLFHFVWEGTSIALLLAGILQLWRPASARVRHGLACLAMAAMPAAFGLTFVRSAPPPPIATTAPASNVPAIAPGQTSSGWIGPLPPSLYSRLPWAVPFWMAGVAFFQLYSFAGWIVARRLRRTGVFPAPSQWRERLAALGARLNLATPVLLLESSLIDVPAVIGVWRPAILLPIALLTGLRTEQLELILLHELAHIRRYDYLVNLLQKSVEALLFYHPAVWWVSGLMRMERENCCDDVVVAASGSPREYALTLATLEWNRSAARDAVLAANGGSPMKRIRRMLKEPETSRAACAPVFSAGLLLLSIALALAALQAKPLPQAQTAPGADLKSDPYQRWMHEVSYIMTQQERASYQALRTDAECVAFIASFWDRRNPTPGAAENKAKEEYYRRLAYANGHFSAGKEGWETDRGRIYVTYGPPDEIESHPRGGTGSISEPNEQWLYHHIEGMGDNLTFGFTDPAGTGEYRLTSNPLAPPVPPPQAGTAPQTIRVGGQVQEQNLIAKVDPVYPPLAMQARIQGTVRFSATIGKDGRVSNLQLISGHPLLIEAAKTALLQWIYRPTLTNGNAVDVVTTVDVNFTLGPK